MSGDLKMLRWFVPEFFYWLWFSVMSLDAHFYEVFDLVGEHYREYKPWLKPKGK